MHLTSQINITSSNKNYILCDYLSFHSARLKNQILYTIRQPITYYQNIKDNKPVFDSQLKVIEAINIAIAQYNIEAKNKFLAAQEKKNSKEELDTNIIDNNELKAELNIAEETEEEKARVIPLIDKDNYWMTNKHLLQYFCKELEQYSSISSKSS